jgi:hypothetical protein
MFFLALFGLPVAYLFVVVVLLIKRQPRGLILSVAAGMLAIMTAVWAVRQSRSSTAGIAYIGLPLIGALGGLLGLAFGRWRSSPERTDKVVAWIGLVGTLLLLAFNITPGMQERSKNRARDDHSARVSAEITRDAQMIAVHVKQNPGREREYIDSIIRARRTDRSFVIAALANDSISPELLDTLANAPDLGIGLEAVRNPSANAQTLTRIYRTHANAEYFFQALASHHHTPPEILRELYSRRTLPGVDTWLAQNPATPSDVLDDISRTTKEDYVIKQLIENPALDRKRVTQLRARLTHESQRDR